MSDYKEAQGNFWKPAEAEEFLEGLYVKKESHVGQNDSNLYFIEDIKTHEMKQVWGTTILDMRMSEVKEGQQVKITYKGLGEKGKGGKQAPHIWKVEYKDADVDLIEAAKQEFDVPDEL